ncbi:hypothetical protein RND71_040825 [Anisodus tanguticus]|uniref:CMP-sialic acid transporter 1 n=1 Tax=Anisodus tanguticus TaxID=243964 RepID=A0AAE1QUQ3_9SOLA|nr:hypothetical protein RND71_040825 [Anisodus tanguticus]
MRWYVVASLLTVLTSSQGILTTLSQSNGGYKYDYATVPFLAEVFKSAALLLALMQYEHLVLLAAEHLLDRHHWSIDWSSNWNWFCLFPSLSCVSHSLRLLRHDSLLKWDLNSLAHGGRRIFSEIFLLCSFVNLQLLVSSVFLWKEMQNSPPPKMTMEWESVRLYPIPSIIYLIHNNVQFATLTYVDTSTYQIMGNLKIVTTGILFRLFLKRNLTNLQWMAVVLLAVGTTTSQHNLFIMKDGYGSVIAHIEFVLRVKGCGEASCDSFFSSPIQGYLFGVLSACLSALAGVYTEFLMKKNNDSMYWQNVQLYTFGSIFNMGRLLMDDFRSGFEAGPWWQRLLNGYNMTTWLVVLNLGTTGLLVSWLMKYADNIVKVYATSMAMLLTMVLSVLLFNFTPTVQLFLGISICMMSLHMYFAPPSTLVEMPLTVKPVSDSVSEVSVERRTDS